MKFKLTIEYDGTNYCGWQKQQDAPSVQAEIESALYKFCQTPLKLTVAGRTDSGVHAHGQVAHFEIENATENQDKFAEFRIVNALNFYLMDKGIVILKCEKTTKDFDARFSATCRYYRYLILNRNAPTALDKNRVWHIPQKLNIESMQEATKYFLGKHDFTSFRSTACQAKNPIRTVNSLTLTKDNEMVFIDISAQSFLHNMVRNITGCLVEVGLNKLEPQAIQDILIAKDRRAAPEKAPACGLYFVKVDYPKYSTI